jgi:hypothetical protein
MSKKFEITQGEYKITGYPVTSGVALQNVYKIEVSLRGQVIETIRTSTWVASLDIIDHLVEKYS